MSDEFVDMEGYLLSELNDASKVGSDLRLGGGSRGRSGRHVRRSVEVLKFELETGGLK